MKPRIVFMGSPDFAVPTLAALAEEYPIVGVVTQPDRPAGRGRKLTAPLVKVLAQELNIPTIQPERLRSDLESKAQIIAWEPDVIVVAAFGQILKTDILELSPFGCVNVHASLLPKWRGVSPIQAAILNGDSKTGITIMKMDEGIDTGPIISQGAIPIEANDTGGSIFEKLAHLGAEILIETLPDYLDGKITPQLQAESPTPYTTMIQKSDGELDFSQPAEVLARKVRAFNPWPGAFTFWEGKPLKIHKAQAIRSESPGIGGFLRYKDLPAIGTSKGLLVIEELQPSGKKSMPGDVFLRGARNWN